MALIIMAVNIPQDQNWSNKYDNSELQTENKARDVAAAYADFSAMQAEKVYLETLSARNAVMGAPTTKGHVWIYGIDTTDGNKRKWVTVAAERVLAKPSEFELARTQVLLKLNDPAITSDDALRKRMAEFDTDSIFELSGKIANYIIDKNNWSFHCC